MVYHACMRRPGLLLVHIVLVSVVLNLADWPYLDEIFGALPTGAISEIFGAKAPDKAAAGGTAAKLRAGYQLLLGLHALPRRQMRLPEPQAEAAPASAPRLLLSSIPQRIDRPPAASRRS